MSVDVEWPLVRIIHKDVYNKAAGLCIRTIGDFGGFLPSVGDTITDLINDYQIDHLVVSRRYFVTELFEPSYWVLETCAMEHPLEASATMIHSLLMTDYFETQKRGASEAELFERFNQLLGFPSRAKRFKPKLRDPDDPEPYAPRRRGRKAKT